jgi:hypothetical protein
MGDHFNLSLRFLTEVHLPSAYESDVSVGDLVSLGTVAGSGCFSLVTPEQDQEQEVRFVNSAFQKE